MEQRQDLLDDRRTWLLLWGLPQLAFVLGFFIAPYRIAIWTASLSVLGLACLLNARRCGRLHCWLAGPFYLLAAVVTLAYGLELLPLGERGWLWLGLAVVVAGNLLTYLPEQMWGKYVDRG
jgi:hypothetical protein